MEPQQTPTPTTTTTTPTPSTTPQPTEPPPPPPPPQAQPQQQPPQPQQQPPPPPPQQQPPSSSSTPTSSNPNPNPTTPTPTPTPPPKPSTLQPPPKPATPQPPQQHHLPQSHPRPTSTPSRPWQQHSHFSQFSSPPPGPTLSSPAPPSVPTPPPRGGMAIGVPASHPSPSSPHPPQFSPSFGSQFGVLGRSGVNVPESASTSSHSQARPGMGIMGSMGSSSQMRPGGISTHHQQRPAQSSPSLRPPSSPSNQPLTTQNFQGHGMLRVSSVGSPVSPAPNTSQSLQSGSSINQPWLSSGSQGKPPLPPPSYRAQINSPSMPQRSHIPQQHHPLPTASQQQHISSAQSPQPSPSHQPQEHYGQQFPPSRVPQSLTHQQQISRVQVSGNQRPSSLTIVQPNTAQPGAQSKMASAESDESGNRILSKRSIHELVNQIDPLEKLDPEVEDILVDIAEEFVDSITTFGCSLAKHRKSDTLEAKDILLHLERNWNMTLPGFGSDEIKSYRKMLTNDIHKERLAVIKKSIVATEVANARTSVGHAAVNAKGNLAKTPANFPSSQKS